MTSRSGGEGEEQMHPQIDLPLYKFRFLFAGLFTVAFLVLISAFVTVLGSGTILATKPSTPIGAFDASMSENPNAITTGAYKLAGGAERMTLATGTALYDACHSITNLTVQSGRSAIHGTAVMVHGVGTGTVFVARGIGSGILFTIRGVGSGVMFTVRLPGKMVGSITHVHTVSALIRPAPDKPVPVISAETSAAALANFSASQQREIARLQAAQLTANQNLGGSVFAGDPTHGGYPAKWDNVAQDSTVDSWGMYSRECVSYAAWKVYQTFGYMPFWGGVGNANQWVRDAKNASIPTSATPKVHAVAISMHGYYGHAMWVEAVSGNMIYVSQYNYDLHGHYSEMWVNGSNFTYIYFK